MTLTEILSELDEQIYGLELRTERSEIIAAHFMPKLDAMLKSGDKSPSQLGRLALLKQYTIDEQTAAQGDRRDCKALIEARLQLGEQTLRINDLYAQVNRLKGASQ